MVAILLAALRTARNFHVRGIISRPKARERLSAMLTNAEPERAIFAVLVRSVAYDCSYESQIELRAFSRTVEKIPGYGLAESGDFQRREAAGTYPGESPPLPIGRSGKSGKRERKEVDRRPCDGRVRSGRSGRDRVTVAAEHENPLPGAVDKREKCFFPEVVRRTRPIFRD